MGYCSNQDNSIFKGDPDLVLVLCSCTSHGLPTYRQTITNHHHLLEILFYTFLSFSYVKHVLWLDFNCTICELKIFQNRFHKIFQLSLNFVSLIWAVADISHPQRTNVCFIRQNEKFYSQHFSSAECYDRQKIWNIFCFICLCFLLYGINKIEKYLPVSFYCSAGNE